MTVTVERPPSVGDALAAVGSLLAEAGTRPLWSVDDGELASLVVEAGAVVGRAQAVLLGLVGEADARGALLGDGAPSAQVWLRHRLRVSPPEAASYVQTARGLRAGLDVTAAACAAGTIGLRARGGDHPDGRRAAARAGAAVGRGGRPGRACPGVRPECVGPAGSAAARPSPTRTRTTPGTADALARAEERAARRMEFTLTPDGEGGSWLRGRLDPAGAATVRAALDPLARAPTVGGGRTGPAPTRPPAGGRAGGAVPAGLHRRRPARQGW